MNEGRTVKEIQGYILRTMKWLPAYDQNSLLHNLYQNGQQYDRDKYLNEFGVISKLVADIIQNDKNIKQGFNVIEIFDAHNGIKHYTVIYHEHKKYYDHNWILCSKNYFDFVTKANIAVFAKDDFFNKGIMYTEDLYSALKFRVASSEDDIRAVRDRVNEAFDKSNSSLFFVTL